VERRLKKGRRMENTPAPGSPPRPRLRLHRDRFGAVERRALAGFAAGALDVDRPLMVNFVVTRRCNLSCGYCQEYDHTSAPVPFETLCERVDHLARLRVVLVAITGGESLLHPRLADLVAYIRAKGMTASVNTNGFLLTAERIRALNDAGLFALQLSVDAVTPNATTKKALRPLLPKLRLLAQHARFRVRVNTVFGAAPPREALEVVQVAAAHGFDAKCSLLRKPDGTPVALDDEARAVYAEITRLAGRSLGLLREGFQDELLRAGQVEWKCRAGARFFHVCEDGLVHLCAPRTGSPATPLGDYTVSDIRRAFDERKACAARCPVAYAHNVSAVDRFRAQRGFEAAPAPARKHLAVIA
jgi:MoaA/NifB/PqqE/SkfB family radical SAM enzyme